MGIFGKGEGEGEGEGEARVTGRPPQSGPWSALLVLHGLLGQGAATRGLTYAPGSPILLKVLDFPGPDGGFWG